MPEYVLRQGDVGVVVQDVLLDAAGQPVDISGASIQWTVYPLGSASAVIDAAATNDQDGGGSNGAVSYEWVAGDSDNEPGPYLGQWEVTFVGGAKQTYPNDGYVLVSITPDTSAVFSSLVSTSELETRLGTHFDAEEHVRAHALLAKASNLVRRVVGQHLSLVADDLLSRPGLEASSLRLPERPVVAVDSVTLDGELLEDWWLAGDTLYRSAGFGQNDQTLEVVYTHGHDPVPADAAAICVEAVARVWINPGSVMQHTIGSTSTTYSTTQGSGLLLTDDEKQALRDLREGAGTVRIT